MLRFVPKTVDGIPLEVDALTPNQLAGKTLDEISRLPVYDGNRERAIGDVFQVSGDATDGCIEIDGDCSRIKGLGKGMSSGSLIIRGNAGMHCGAEMTGGRLEVHGNASDWLGAEMRGGLIHVHGNVGNSTGGAYRGAPKGMRGGTILIEGNAGHELGANMRRGLIAVRGQCGEMAGHAMIAGSIFAFGGIGIRPGAGMKRGSIVVLHGSAEICPTFRFDCDYEPVFLQLYFKQLAAMGFGGSCSPKLFRRFSGDLLTLGKGEILVAV